MTTKRYFEFSEGTSNKFWEVWVDGSELRTRYGKIGTGGSVTVKDEGTPEKAQKLHDKLVAEKTKKGYAEKGGAPAPAAKAAPAPKPPAKAKAEDDDDGDEDDDDDDDDEAGEGGGGAGWRRFEVDEKFWAIKLDGSSHTVKYGKIGTAGAEKTKDFGDDDEAQKDYDKLVKEKTKKGYEELRD